MKTPPLKPSGPGPTAGLVFFARPKKTDQNKGRWRQLMGFAKGAAYENRLCIFEQRPVFVGPIAESGSMRNRSTRLSQTPALHDFESHTSPSPFRPARIRRSSVGVIGTHNANGPPLHATEMPPAGEAAFCLVFCRLTKN